LEAVVTVNWSKDVDSSLAKGWRGALATAARFQRGARLRSMRSAGAESYADHDLADFIHGHFVPVEANLNEHPAWFHRFDAVWTPTILLFDSTGKERVRLEAERRYDEVVTHVGASHVAAEAMFWRGVSRYSRTHDHVVLKKVAEELRKTYPASGGQ
jgi:hypothetical protein